MLLPSDQSPRGLLTWSWPGDLRLIVLNSLLAGWWGPVWALMAGALARRGRGAKVRWAPGLVAGTAAVLAYQLAMEGPLP